MSTVQLSDESNKYFSSFYDEELKLYELVWHKASEYMEEHEYKALMQADRDKVLKNYEQLNFILINLTERLDTMSPELQEWSSKNVSVYIFEKYNILKVAVVNSRDFSTQFSLEQALEEDKESENITKYFDKAEDAKAWLFNVDK
ncbi:hypothetical protein [Microscilla marina]|uniref:STAS/SEC14 domain-containing protein n=1 Tax=Microscilla marina ATCC 23134 TaxID=313606 RepID=A1ZXB3_MICM2|nr:hypothetical protein [Microscilla marina]EAY24987.1 hypothetical protein M23134_03701 [Microscilla marina ATCC 23134]